MFFHEIHKKRNLDEEEERKKSKKKKIRNKFKKHSSAY